MHMWHVVLDTWQVFGLSRPHRQSRCLSLRQRVVCQVYRYDANTKIVIRSKYHIMIVLILIVSYDTGIDVVLIR